jgi:hypothetical protein
MSFSRYGSAFLLSIIFFSANAVSSATADAKNLVRDEGAEDVVSKLLLRVLADNNITSLSSYQPSLLREGVCSSAYSGAWVPMMTTDGGPKAFYKTSDPGQPTPELQKLVVDTAKHSWPMSRYAVAVWKEKSTNAPPNYWVGIILSKSAFSNWAGMHFGADTPGEMISPYDEAKKSVVPACRHQ